MYQDIAEFGTFHNLPGLSETVSDLYDAALKDSSRRTYKTGQKAYVEFVTTNLRKTAPLFPFRPSKLNSTELYLAFFMASLVMKPTISSASTIFGYACHCKYWFRSEGCDPGK